MQMRKKDYILATDFPAQIKATMNRVMGEYEPELQSALQKAENVLTAAKTVEKFNLDIAKKDEENRANEEFDLEL